MGAKVYCVGVKDYERDQVIQNRSPSATFEPSWGKFSKAAVPRSPRQWPSTPAQMFGQQVAVADE